MVNAIKSLVLVVDGIPIIAGFALFCVVYALGAVAFLTTGAGWVLCGGVETKAYGGGGQPLPGLVTADRNRARMIASGRLSDGGPVVGVLDMLLLVAQAARVRARRVVVVVVVARVGIGR